jgi:hypothetical protein
LFVLGGVLGTLFVGTILSEAGVPLYLGMVCGFGVAGVSVITLQFNISRS